MSSTNSARTDAADLIEALNQRSVELEQAIAQLTKRLEAVLEVGASISAAREVDALLATVMERLTSLLGAEAATVFVHEPETRQLWSRVRRGGTSEDIRIKDDQGLAGHVFATGKTVLLGDAYEDPRFNAEVDRRSGFRTRSLITAVLRHVGGQKLGVLQVLDRRLNLFTPADRALVEGVASQIAAVLDHMRLVSELEARLDDLDALYSVEQALNETTRSADLVKRILSVSSKRLGATAGSVLLIEDGQQTLYFHTVQGERAEALSSVRLEVGQGIAGHVAATKTIVRVQRAEDSDIYDRSFAKRLGLPTGAVLCVPIIAGAHTLGALELLNKPGGFSDRDEQLAVLLAGQVGRALERRQSREEEERKARLATVGQMLGGVLHDLRTPMTVIGGYAEMMASEDDPAMRAQMTKHVLTQLEHIAVMQQETLAFVRGEKTVFVRRVYLHTFMQELIEQLQQEFAASKVELKVLVGYTGAAKFDEIKITRAIFNFARNAIDAMPDGGRFLLSVERDADDLVFRAKDNGPGIPKEIADRLFESFVSSGKRNGTGLGLALVRQIAREHNGSVTFKSAPGKGTTFELRFPAGSIDG